MPKNKTFIFLIIAIAGISLFFTCISLANTNEKIESGYHTLKGEIYEEGTGTISTLIFVTQQESYLIRNNTKKLSDLKGIPLLLTGKVDRDDNQKPYQGQIDVTHYNTDYDRSEQKLEEVSILGELVEKNDDLILLTPDQIVINLDSDTYHSLQEYVGQEVLITGSFSRKNKHKADMKVKSYRIIKN